MQLSWGAQEAGGEPAAGEEWDLTLEGDGGRQLPGGGSSALGPELLVCSSSLWQGHQVIRTVFCFFKNAHSVPFKGVKRSTQYLQEEWGHLSPQSRVPYHVLLISPVG